MNRYFFIYEALEKLRHDTRRNGEPAVLELPVPRPEPRAAAEEIEERDANRGVVIIDMNDYSEMKV